ncbi:MAG: Maf-like protein [Planctomycetes bacterium]|nr:Maf-like protein [Planctomycetota bacterium]
MREPVLQLASTSPRRRSLLQAAGIPFVLCEPGPELDHLPPRAGVTPRDLARERARRKALGAAAPASGLPVLGVDTVVDLDGVELGKPRDRDEAAAMLHRLIGRRHAVHTAHCLVAPGGDAFAEEIASATVTCRTPGAAEIAAYLASGDWHGKAGAYGLQDPTQSFLCLAEGAFDTVVGLHVPAVLRLLAAATGRP